MPNRYVGDLLHTIGDVQALPPQFMQQTLEPAACPPASIYWMRFAAGSCA